MSDIGSRLVVVSGPSGAGKDTIVAKLIEKDDRFSLAVSATTRKIRNGETDGVNYYFLDEDYFLKKIEENAFVEYAKYNSSYYGTLKSDVEMRINNGKIVVLVIEVQGAGNIKKLYPDSTSVFIMPPSEEILIQRLRNRKTETEEQIANRIKIAKSEMKKSAEYDFTVINDDLDVAVNELHSILIEHIK